MVLIVDVQLTGIEKLKKSKVNKALKNANKKLGLRWRRFKLPAHFTETGERRYQFAPRSKRYQKFKKEKLGHHHDLVFTGDGKREALRSKKVKPARNSVTIPLPRKFNLRPRSGRTNLSKEIRAVTRSELNELTKFLTVQIDKELAHEVGQGPSLVKHISIVDNG